MESRCLLIFLFRYVIAAGLENGRIQLLSSVDMQQLDQWGLWHSLDERYKRERERERESWYMAFWVFTFLLFYFLDFVITALFVLFHGVNPRVTICYN